MNEVDSMIAVANKTQALRAATNQIDSGIRSLLAPEDAFICVLIGPVGVGITTQTISSIPVDTVDGRATVVRLLRALADEFEAGSDVTCRAHELGAGG